MRVKGLEKIILQANNEMELLRELSLNNIIVGPRGKRLKDEVEKWTIFRLLSTFLKENKVEYPFEVVHRDRPDFKLCMGLLEVGVEHTEAVPENEARKEIIRDRIDSSEIYFLTKSMPGDKPKKYQELMDEVIENKSGPGWVGNAPEREWAEVMCFFSIKKIEAIKKSEFKKYKKNWLLIYDNWPLPPGIDFQQSLALFRDFAKKYEVFNHFNRVYIISGSQLCEVELEKFKVFEINDLWRIYR